MFPVQTSYNTALAIAVIASSLICLDNSVVLQHYSKTEHSKVLPLCWIAHSVNQ